MTAIGMGLAFAGYAGFLFGYCLLRDYNVTLAALFRTTWPGAGSGGAKTPASQVTPAPGGGLTRAQQLLGE